jgi:hypothetical protein
MCNFIPVRNWLIALGIFAGFAASSAYFAMIWQKSGGFPIVTSISYSAAGSWAVSALITMAFTFGALATFCTCAAAVPACAAACTAIRTALTALMVALIALIAGCIVGAADWADLGEYIFIWVSLAASAVAIAMGTVAFYGSRLGSCGAP